MFGRATIRLGIGPHSSLDINWDDVLDISSASVDEMWEKFKFTLLDGMQAFIPKGNQRSRSSKKNYQPFSTEIKQMVHKNIDYGNFGLYVEMLLIMTSTKKFVTWLKMQQLN